MRFIAEFLPVCSGVVILTMTSFCDQVHCLRHEAEQTWTHPRSVMIFNR